MSKHTLPHRRPVGIDRLGEVSEFPKKLGHFPVLLAGSNEFEVFALQVTAEIPQAEIQTGDYLIFDYGKKPQPGDICIFPFGMNGKWLLCGIASKTYDNDTATKKQKSLSSFTGFQGEEKIQSVEDKLQT